MNIQPELPAKYEANGRTLDIVVAQADLFGRRSSGGTEPYSSANGQPMPMPEDIQIFKVVPIHSVSLFEPIRSQ